MAGRKFHAPRGRLPVKIPHSVQTYFWLNPHCEVSLSSFYLAVDCGIYFFAKLKLRYTVLCYFGPKKAQPSETQIPGEVVIGNDCCLLIVCEALFWWNKSEPGYERAVPCFKENQREGLTSFPRRWRGGPESESFVGEVSHFFPLQPTWPDKRLSRMLLKVSRESEFMMSSCNITICWAEGKLQKMRILAFPKWKPLEGREKSPFLYFFTFLGTSDPLTYPELP